MVALKSRSIPAQEAVDSVARRRWHWLRAQGCKQFVFKYCSTFDSTPAGQYRPGRRSAGERARRLRRPSPARLFRPPAARVYQGHLFVDDRLLNESGMENHPLNPMTDADLARWLSRQCKDPVGLVPWTHRAARRRRDPYSARRRRPTPGSASSSSTRSPTTTCSRSARPARTSLSSPAAPASRSACPRIYPRRPRLGPGQRVRGRSGPEAILAGSCSKATLGQIERHKRDHPALPDRGRMP